MTPARLRHVTLPVAFALALALPLGACHREPPATAFDGEFEGFFLQGIEVSSFVPCGSWRGPGNAVGYWLEWGNSGAFPQYEKVMAAFTCASQATCPRWVHTAISGSGAARSRSGSSWPSTRGALAARGAAGCDGLSCRHRHGCSVDARRATTSRNDR